MLTRLSALLASLFIFSVYADEPAPETLPDNNSKIEQTNAEHTDSRADNLFGKEELKQAFIPFLSGNIAVDATLDEPQWQQANHFTLDFVTQPFDNTAAPVKTDVYIFEDGQTLYIGFIAYDPAPHEISGFYRDRDKIWSNDLVGIKLDTFNNERLAYQFFVNPHGVQADAIENEMTKSESDSWNAIWDSAGQITETGYVVEMAIPLRAMNFDEQSERKIWGAEFVRFYPRNENYRISNLPYDRNNECVLCQLGEIEGFNNASQGNNLAIIPTLVVGAGRKRDVFSAEDWKSFDNQEVGVDVNWGITPQMSLQATINPDFSQVEADVAQVSINNTFSLYFDELRPFFVENAGYFSSNQELVYTRNISNPDYGAKLTGQTGDHTFGIFAANDETTQFLVPGNLSSSVASLNTESINTALRYRYDMSDDFSIGWVSTLRDADEYHNYVNGADVKFRISEQDTLRAQYVVSDTQYPFTLYEDFCANDCTSAEDNSEIVLRTRQDDAFSGQSWRVNYFHQERDWFFNADHFANDRDFRADLGFESRADFHKSILGAGYMWWNDTGWWNRIRLKGDWDITHSDEGELLEREVEAYLSIRGTYQSFVEIGHVKRQRVGLRFDPSSLAIDGNTDLFNESSNSFYMETRPNSLLFVSTFARIGDQIDFANNRLGEQLYVESRMDVNIGSHAQLSARQIYSDLDVDNAKLFIARISDLRLTYQFDARQFLRLIMIYNNTYRNQANYAAPVDSYSRQLGAQLLYSYKVNPLTKFFVGVGSAAIDEPTLDGLRDYEQSVFMKFSYAWLQ
ncbi:carbohydrate binding family 9 domain-containing protein [Alteromonas ponticola]|uniref:Carbohydrate binding family 9 domain-containing protein n=1 Tax=Alteromonas ponticola TaxID=2720613 RepID=A0ABX1R369_9ALTE|nr:carbohydrate binding family 9 domain-containing protein [Alteromonas ponticola]NMH60889.1 carbohydrate binding family 9 domain-containing protein [Alteromonas ponticola]